MSELPTYRQTLRKAAIGMLTTWRNVPEFSRDAFEALREFATATWWLTFVLAVPFFFLLSPLVAWLYLWLLRAEKAQREERKKRYVAGLKGEVKP